MEGRIELARELMARFAERTGVASDGPQRRYLWTDAFAVCNFLGLARATGDARHEATARRLVDDVHHVLGRHRADDARHGWISGLGDADGERHPTAGGLRIGKPLPERAPGEAYDEELEWQRDGQYFHYLTKWMHALDQAARATGEEAYERWAHELARRAHAAFAWRPRPDAPRRLYWKCSIDLSRPLVPSMGQHDPLDGFVTCLQLDAAAAPGGDLRAVIDDLATMLAATSLASSDPLGIGGLLVDAYRLHRLGQQGVPEAAGRLVDALLAAAATGLRLYATQPDLRAPAERRLAFRELGLAIGLAAAARLADESRGGDPAVARRLAQVERFLALREYIEDFWTEPAHRAVASWTEHQDIGDVMLATSLAPDGFLVAQPLGDRA